MKTIFSALFIVLAAAGMARAQDVSVIDRWQADRSIVFDAADITLDDLQWVARPLVIFADTPNDPRFQQQLTQLLSDADRLAERDVIMISDTDPAARNFVRIALRPRGFALTLVDKDGRVTLRKPAPYSVRELTASIDKSPLRQQEIEDRRGENIR